MEGIEAEPHHVWEYPSYPRSDILTLMTFDLSAAIHGRSHIHREGSIPLTELALPCHGVVMWMDYVLTAEHTVTTGLLEVCMLFYGMFLLVQRESYVINKQVLT